MDFVQKDYKDDFSSLKWCNVFLIYFSNIKQHIAQQGAKYKQANAFEVSYGWQIEHRKHVLMPVSLVAWSLKGAWYIENCIVNFDVIF